jgi:hypothetical protein
MSGQVCLVLEVGWCIIINAVGHVTELFRLRRLYDRMSFEVRCGWWEGMSVAYFMNVSAFCLVRLTSLWQKKPRTIYNNLTVNWIELFLITAHDMNRTPPSLFPVCVCEFQYLFTEDTDLIVTEFLWRTLRILCCEKFVSRYMIKCKTRTRMLLIVISCMFRYWPFVLCAELCMICR